MNKEAAIKLNTRWIEEKQVIIDEHEEKIAALRNDIASYVERIDSLNTEEVKAK